MKKKHVFAFASAIAALATVAAADPLPKQQFKVVGTWGTASMYKDYEAPMWNKDVPEASDGSITADVQAITDLGLSGTETIKLLSTGAYDVGFALYAYIVSGNPVFEGFDLALVPQNADEQRKLVDAYSPVVEKAMSDIHHVKLMTNYPFPLPVLACRDKFTGISDLKGRKIRTFSTTLGDMVEGLGGISVSIPLAEVPTALQRGVVDCAVSSGIAMYNAKWFDVVHYLYQMPIVSGMGFVGMTQARWDKLDAATQAFLAEQSKKFEDKTWAQTKEDEQQGIACLTGETLGGPACRHGDPAGMTLVRTSDEDAATRKRVLTDFVLKRFGERCGADCAKVWNQTAGASVGLSIPE
jgi:TRAP-type C4-dicarboxylate transport system substrate-binding protein